MNLFAVQILEFGIGDAWVFSVLNLDLSGMHKKVLRNCIECEKIRFLALEVLGVGRRSITCELTSTR